MATVNHDDVAHHVRVVLMVPREGHPAVAPHVQQPPREAVLQELRRQLCVRVLADVELNKPCTRLREEAQGGVARVETRLADGAAAWRPGPGVVLSGLQRQGPARGRVALPDLLAFVPQELVEVVEEDVQLRRLPAPLADLSQEAVDELRGPRAGACCPLQALTGLQQGLHVGGPRLARLLARAGEHQEDAQKPRCAGQVEEHR
mmetsp:Transcript_89412/g.266720  ORF Transcript_89412/g.266720 Transcript_89412/m.266720 type:complete len:204 (+) Transcript_89412:319-930(+)